MACYHYRGADEHHSDIYRHSRKKKHTTVYPGRRYGDAQGNEMFRKSTLGKFKICMQGCNTVVRSAAGESNSFGVEVGLHQGSVLSPYMFLLITDVLTDGVRN